MPPGGWDYPLVMTNMAMENGLWKIMEIDDFPTIYTSIYKGLSMAISDNQTVNAIRNIQTPNATSKFGSIGPAPKVPKK